MKCPHCGHTIIQNDVRPCEWARETGTPINTIRWWLREGVLTKRKVGRAVFLKRHELERKLNQHRTQTVEERIGRVTL